MSRNNQATRSAAPPTAPKAFSLIADAKLKQLYAAMLRCRLLDERLCQLPRQRKSKYLSSAGNEAAIVGAAIDLRRADWLIPQDADFAASVLKGVLVPSIVSRLECRAPDAVSTSTSGISTVGGPRSPQDDPRVDSALKILSPLPSLPAQLALAAGVAVSAKARNKGEVVVAFGESASAFPTDLRPTLQFAAQYRLPLLLVMNQPSMRISTTEQNGSRPLAVAAQACGIPVIPVDRTDAVAMYRVAFESIHKARHDGGPTVIEAAAWRLRGRQGAIETGTSTDPIQKMEGYLSAKGLFTAQWKQGLVDRFMDEAQSARGFGSKA